MIPGDFFGETGGPAFPHSMQVRGSDHGDVTYHGLTARDWFAGKALQGYLASFPSNSEPAEVASTIAKDCYKLADAMLAAREA